MKARLVTFWDRLRSSFWFLPTVMAGGSAALAFGSVALDETVTEEWIREWGWAYSGGAQGASTVLGAVAGSMITIAGVVFSMTLVVLSLASSQFGPRLLRNFMRDTANQFVLGTFLSTFLYCMLVLRTIRHEDEIAFVPHLSVTLGVLFAVASLGVLIYFIHHVAVSIQADQIVARVSDELIEGIDRLFPEQLGHGAPGPAAESAGLPERFEAEAQPVPAAGDGYVQFIDADALMALAVEEDVILQVKRRPGHYVIASRPLVRVWPGGRMDEKFAERVNGAFILGTQRTPNQDIEFAVDQLVEIGVRALSPGVNDPFTAITCVDRLGSALCRLAERAMPSAYRRDEQEQLRVVVPAATFPAVTDAAFNQIRQFGQSSAAVTIRLLETIAVVAQAATRSEDRAALGRHAKMIIEGARRGLSQAEDLQAAEERYQAVRDAIGELPDAAAGRLY